MLFFRRFLCFRVEVWNSQRVWSLSFGHLGDGPSSIGCSPSSHVVDGFGGTTHVWDGCMGVTP